jgi:Mn2+/Fe2+ NRAMP family transporter
MTGVGTSHLVTVPTAGGRFAYALLWCVPLAYVIKYYGFEMAFRFTHGTGKTLIEAYGTAWKKWPLWYLLITTLLQCAVGQAGRLIAASAVVYFFVSSTMGWDVPMAVYGLVLGVGSVAIILMGGYRAVELTAKAFAALLIVALVAVYMVQPAPASALQHFFIVQAPAGSWLVIAALLGLLPTGMDVSLQASEWGKAKNVGLGSMRGRLEESGLARRFDPFRPQKEDLAVDRARLPSTARDQSARWFRIGLWDFRLGHIISFVQASVFLLLAATWLYPSQVEGQAVMGEIGRTFTASVGPWMMIVFLISAFAATFSTAFNYFDGWPRIVGACCRNLFKGTARLKGIKRDAVSAEGRSRWYSEYNIYRLTMVYSLVAAVAIMAGLPQPVLLVLIASAVALFIAPVIYFLNLYYCLAIIPKSDKVFYPSRFARWFATASLVLFTGLTLVLILVWVLRVPLLGA